MFLTPFLMCLSSFVGDSERLGGTSDDIARSVAIAYEANRATFPYGTLHFDHSVGRAKSLADALKGNWSERSVASGFFVYDGVRGRIENVFPLEEMVAKRNPIREGSWSSLLTSTRNVTDGHDTLFDNIIPNDEGTALQHTTQITKTTQAFYFSLGLPNGLGYAGTRPGSLSDYINKSLNDNAGWSLRMAPRDRSGHGGEVELKLKSSEYEMTYVVDLARGAIPIRTSQRRTAPALGPNLWSIQGDLREIPGHGWLPFRLLIYRENGGLVREYTIRDVDFDQPPKSDAFSLEFDQPLKLRDQVRGVDYMPTKSIDLANLPAADPGTKFQVDIPDLNPPVMPGEIQPGFNWSIFSLVVGCVLLVAAVVFYRKRG